MIFRNALEFELVGAKPVYLHYNVKHSVLKLKIHFRAKLYECFENNENEFPFECQYLNAQIAYRMGIYNFQSKVPDFVKEAFCHDDYQVK